MKTKFLTLCSVTLAIVATSCSKLNEQLYGAQFITPQTASASDLKSVYGQLDGIATQSNTFALQEHSTDEMMGPTRGTDWGDFGTWRKLHTHTWDASYGQISDTWDYLNIGSYRATQVIVGTTDNQLKAEASFLRAYFTYQICDLFGQVPYRDPAGKTDAIPVVYSRSQAVDHIIADLQFAITNLGAAANAGQASKAAAEALLAKVYLNKAVYTAAAPGGPYTFSADDMNNVIKYCNMVQATGAYSLAAPGKYYSNFSWDNATTSTEIIFGRLNTSSNAPANSRFTWRMGTHYLQATNGWNGFTTLSDFYNSFDKADERLGGSVTGLTDVSGMRSGFLIGQQYGPGGVALKQRGGQPLIFTPNVDLNFSTEAQGIRVIKYLPHPNADGTVSDDNTTNTYVLLRYADVRLMKAEALLRGGTDPNGETALTIVNDIRTRRGLTALGSIAIADMLKERGHELFYEGWRRNDQIRFGTFNDPVDQRSAKSDPTRTLYAIPQRAVDTNPNLKQNAGY